MDRLPTRRAIENRLGQQPKGTSKSAGYIQIVAGGKSELLPTLEQVFPGGLGGDPYTLGRGGGVYRSTIVVLLPPSLVGVR